jgi:WXXGXW repeat (2 copies)
MQPAKMIRYILPLLIALTAMLAQPTISSAHPARAARPGQVDVGISVGIAPPPLPYYEQPFCPGEGYIWTPGYWAWDGTDYYWVPGTWVLAPFVGGLWTPGYWGWGGSAFLWHEGYWGPSVGFYGGINYGFGYTGIGYLGGRWNGGVFEYNTSVNRINGSVVHNTYSQPVSGVHPGRVSYNGGTGGIQRQPSHAETAAAGERRAGPTSDQAQHEQVARTNPAQHFSTNQGKPAVAATGKAGDFKTNSQPAATRPAYRAPAGNTSGGGSATTEHTSNAPAHTTSKTPSGGGGGAPHTSSGGAPHPSGGGGGASHPSGGGGAPRTSGGGGGGDKPKH